MIDIDPPIEVCQANANRFFKSGVDNILQTSRYSVKMELQKFSEPVQILKPAAFSSDFFAN